MKVVSPQPFKFYLALGHSYQGYQDRVDLDYYIEGDYPAKTTLYCSRSECGEEQVTTIHESQWDGSVPWRYADHRLKGFTGQTMREAIIFALTRYFSEQA
jgi:hypothetical protein